MVRLPVPRAGAGPLRRRRAVFLLLGLAAFTLLPLTRRVAVLAGTVPARLGRVAAVRTGEALLVREERVLFTVGGGQLVPLAREGERVPRGAPVARLWPDPEGPSETLQAPMAGTVSYVLDGLEEVLGPQALGELMQSRESPVEVALQGSPQSVLPGPLHPGRAAVKVVDNFHVWLLVELATDRRLPAPGERVRLRLRGAGGPSGAPYTATVLQRRDRQGKTRLLLAPAAFWPELARLRRVTVDVSLGEYEGVMVPRSALVHRRDQEGVMVDSWRGRLFQPVSVRGGDDAWVVVDGLAPGTRVWKEPRGSG